MHIAKLHEGLYRRVYQKLSLKAFYYISLAEVVVYLEFEYKVFALWNAVLFNASIWCGGVTFR